MLYSIISDLTAAQWATLPAKPVDTSSTISSFPSCLWANHQKFHSLLVLKRMHGYCAVSSFLEDL